MREHEIKRNYKEAYEHLKVHWHRAQKFLLDKDYPLATVSAVTLIEEVGKFQALVVMEKSDSSDNLSRSFLKDHNKKYIFATVFNLLINSRTKRIYGDKIDEFIEIVNKGELFKKRNQSMYAEIAKDQISVPAGVVNSDEAIFITLMAGEIFAEASNEPLGSAKDWAEICSEIDRVRDGLVY